MKLYQALARTLGAIPHANAEWRETHQARLESLAREHFPWGSGFDAGCKLLDESTPERLVISADFHHMNDHGTYCGWSEHKVIVTPCLQFGYQFRVTGRDMRQIKDYISDVFHSVLTAEIEGYGS